MAADGTDQVSAGLSAVNGEQIAEAQSIASVVCVQNFDNIANRADPPFDFLAAHTQATARQVALARLLQRARNIWLVHVPRLGVHLREDIAGAAPTQSRDDLAPLNGITS